MKPGMRLLAAKGLRWIALTTFAVFCTGWDIARGGTLDIEQSVAIARQQNPDIQIAQKKLQAARAGIKEARAGSLPSVVSAGTARKREQQTDSRLRSNDYNASVRVVQSVYSGGEVGSRLAIARLNVEKAELEYQSVVDRVSMEVRVAFDELLLNRSKTRVRTEAVDVLQQELKTQTERLGVGTVGELNVRRAEVTLATEQPELIAAQSLVKNSYLRLGELLALPARESGFKAAGELRYQTRLPALNECLVRAERSRPEIRSREIDVEIEDQQLLLDRSDLRPHVDVFSGYEIYNERDPQVGQEFNHGYVVGVNGSWKIFDGFATKGRVEATRARRDAAVLALEAEKRAVESDVRSAFLDLQQAESVLHAQTKTVETADQSLEIAKGNLSAGLGTQLEVFQAATDITRARTTRLSAIYLHNVALARLAKACATDPATLSFANKAAAETANDHRVFDVAQPPAKLTKR